MFYYISLTSLFYRLFVTFIGDITIDIEYTVIVPEPQLVFLSHNIHQIFGIIGFFNNGQSIYAICIIPCQTNQAMMQLQAYSSKKNLNFYKKVNKQLGIC